MERLRTGHEKNLRRASEPLALFAALLVMLPLRPDVYERALHPRPLAVLGVILMAALVWCIPGARRCLGLRNGRLATRAALCAALGLALSLWLWRLPWGDQWDAVVRKALGPMDEDGDIPVMIMHRYVLLVGVWLAVTGTVRLLLLMVPMTGALAKVRR